MSRLTPLVGLLLVAAVVAGCSPGSASRAGTSSPRTPLSVTGDPRQVAARIAADLADEDLVGQMLMPFAYGDHATKVADSAAAANRKAYGVPTPAEVVRRYRLGGVILVRRSDDGTDTTNPTSNVRTPKQVRRLTGGLQDAAGKLPAAGRAKGGLPLLVGTDQEYGVVTRIRDGMTLLPTAMGLGAGSDPEATESAWAMAGSELSAVGVNVDFAPDADVIGESGNHVIGSRSYGSDPKVVSRHVAAAVRGLQGAGVAATLKHFPGHGHTSTDSHTALPSLAYSRKALEQGDLPPFTAGIASDAQLVMPGHLDVRAVDSGVPATFSKKVLVDLLRDELGFDGVVVSDAMNMEPAQAWPPDEAAVRAVLAGNDVLLMPPDLEAAQRGLLDAMSSGRLPRDHVVRSVTRILTLKLRLADHQQPALTGVDSGRHHKIAARAADRAVTVLRGRCGGPLVSGTVRITGGTPQQRDWLSGALRRYGVDAGASGDRVHLTGYGDTPADLASGAEVTVGMDTPYLLSEVRSPTVLAAFGATTYAMEAVAGVLAGKAKATGRSPVPVKGLPRTACEA